MKHKRIGLDLDGVLCDFNTALAAELGVTARPYVPDVWDWPQTVADSQLIKRVWSQITEAPEWWRNVPPYPNSRELDEVLFALRKQGHDLYFITSRPSGPGMKQAATNWLCQNLGIGSPTVLMAHSSMDKGYLAHGLHLTLFVDDKPESCTAVRSTCGSKCDVVLMDWPYNREWSHPYVRREQDLVAVLTGQLA